MAERYQALEPLSGRERQIAEAYAEDLSYRQVAERLRIAPATVRTHLGTIYRKLGVSTKIQLHKALKRDARPEKSEAARVAAETSDRWWTVSSADPPTAGGPLSTRLSRLRKEARGALQSGLVGSEQIEPWLRASDIHFRAVTEALPGVVLLKNQALRYVFANRFFLDQWQLRPGHVVGRTQQEVFSGGLGFAWSRATDDRDARVLQTGQATGLYVVRVPVEAGRDTVLWARKIPLRNDEGSVSHVLTVGIDITALDRVPKGMSTCLPSTEAPLPASPRATGPARILVIDMEPETRQLAIEALERIGHTVETAASCREALAVLGMQTIDLIVADIRMADMDGSGLHGVLAERRPELLERLVFTARADLPADLKGFVSETGLEILEKPFSARDIVARTEARLAASDARLRS